MTAACRFLGAAGAILLGSGSPRFVVQEAGVSEALVAELLARLDRNESFPRLIDGSQIALAGLPEGRLLAVSYGARRDLSAAELEPLGLFAQLSATDAGQRRGEERRLQAVTDIQQTISAETPLVEIFRSMYGRMAAEMDTPIFAAAALDVAAQQMRYLYVMQDGIERSPSELAPRPLLGPLADVVGAMRPARVDDTDNLPEEIRAVVLGDGPRPVRSMLLAPMLHRGDVKGVIEARSYAVAAFGDEDAYLLSTLASQAAAALEGARFLEESQRQVERLTLLNQVMVATSRIDNPVEASREALALILPALHEIDMASVWIRDYDQPGLVRLASFGFPKGGYLVERQPLDSEAFVSRAAKSGHSQIVRMQPDTQLPSVSRPFIDRNHIETLINLPMRTAQRIVGVLTLACTHQRSVDLQEQEFLETLAGQLGSALEAVTMRDRHDAERRRLQTIIENLPEAIAIADADGRITVHNHAAEVLWGHPPREVPLEEVPHAYGLYSQEGRTLAWRETPLALSLVDGVPSSGRELLIRRPDGSEVPILSNCVPVRDTQGKISGSVEVFQDITKLKEVDRLKDDFINTVSHELRTPTTTIRGGALTLLRRGEALDDATKRQLLRDMSEEAERLHILVEDLLSLSRSQAGMQLTTEPVIPHRFVNHMILEMGSRVGEHSLTVHVPADLPMVEADPFCLEQIFRNLLENAVKFSPSGQRIEVSGEAGDGDVIFSVMDRGSGIPAKDIGRVFEPFYRSDEVVNAGAQGAGLGLAVCERFARMQGGRIWAEARAGGGTAFRFTVPSIGEPAGEEV